MALEFPAFFHYATPHSYANAHRTYFNIHSCIQVSLSHSLIANESDNNKYNKNMNVLMPYMQPLLTLFVNTLDICSHTSSKKKAGRK